MDINFLAVLIGGVVAMVLGAVWYGPLFGKKWMMVIGATEMDEAKKKEMQKAAMPLYGIQFVLALLQVYILAWLAVNIPAYSTYWLALATFVGFIVPALAGASMWNNDSAKVSWTRFLLQAGYHLVLFIILGFILGIWL